ncbi:hypothetical protein R3P38DRAFT_2910950 [Favolaschia claudopus]|uniref:DUF6593 domain-containing protein n=1 Tax=Favolaschia claudopus TaxID=2862362 RepID=A0AAW0CCY7_9AGAR
MRSVFNRLPMSPRAICLAFETDSMLNTTLCENAVPLYRVTTNTHGSITEIRTTGSDTLIARIARKNIFPSTVTFPDVNGGKPMRIKEWLKPTKFPNGLLGCTLQTPLGDMIMGGHPEYNSIALFNTDLTQIIAHWKPKSDSLPLILVLSPGYESAHAQIIAAFLYEEQVIRVEHKNSELAEAQGRLQARYPYLLSFSVPITGFGAIMGRNLWPN